MARLFSIRPGMSFKERRFIEGWKSRRSPRLRRPTHQSAYCHEGGSASKSCVNSWRANDPRW
jgi:hypothetical protein